MVAALALGLSAGQAEARRTGGARTVAIDMIVTHSTGGPTCEAATGKPLWVEPTLDENMRQIEAHPGDSRARVSTLACESNDHALI